MPARIPTQIMDFICNGNLRVPIADLSIVEKCLTSSQRIVGCKQPRATPILLTIHQAHMIGIPCGSPAPSPSTVAKPVTKSLLRHLPQTSQFRPHLPPLHLCLLLPWAQFNAQPGKRVTKNAGMTCTPARSRTVLQQCFDKFPTNQ